MGNRLTYSSLRLLGGGILSAKVAIIVLVFVSKTHVWAQVVGAGCALAATMCFATVLERLVKKEDA